jgi:type IV pilus assembly protein PilX
MVIVLIVLVSMLTAAVAVLRSADNAGVLATNVALRQNLIQEGEISLQYVTDRITSSTAIPNFSNATPGENYVPVRLAENSRGVPLVLASLKPPPEAGVTGYPHERWNDQTKVLTRYVIEGICNPGTNPADPPKCALAPAAGAANPGGDAFQDRIGFPGGMYIRATIRLDGPRNTVVYMQTIVR